MIYRLLGELEIRHDGQLLDLPGGPALIVLAVLLLNANRQMSKTALIRAAWGNDEVSEAQLYKRVMAVRDLLTQIGHRDDLKTHARFGYELRVADGDADALAFTQLIREAAEAGAEHRTEDEIGCLRQALQLWRGPHPLSNVPSDAFRRDAAALEQRLKRAAVRLFELELARGNHELILDELMLIAGYYPDDRRLSEQLMIAQYWCGHLADVSRVYERYRDALAEETGAQPDPLLRNLHFAIGLGDEEAIAAAEAALTKRAGTPARPIVTVPRQLPRPVDLVGRDALAAEVSWLLRSEPGPAMPVVVISGPGGIGKTALALRAAHESSDRYPDGQLYVELRGTIGGAVDTGEALAQFLRALGVPRVPETTGERLAQYRTLLADRRVLVVLDDAATARRSATWCRPARGARSWSLPGSGCPRSAAPTTGRHWGRWTPPRRPSCSCGLSAMRASAWRPIWTPSTRWWRCAAACLWPCASPAPCGCTIIPGRPGNWPAGWPGRAMRR